MSLYEKYCLPRIIHWACGMDAISQQRRKVVPGARGRVLEVGMGTGLNLPFYNDKAVDSLVGIEPSGAMRQFLRKSVAKYSMEVELFDYPASHMSFEDNSFDTIVLTYTLCTVDDPESSLLELKRVLKPYGKLLYTEHGLSPDKLVLKTQKFLNPFWYHFAGGCRLDRPIEKLLTSTGFQLEENHRGYLPQTPRFGGFNYWGIATKS